MDDRGRRHEQQENVFIEQVPVVMNASFGSPQRPGPPRSVRAFSAEISARDPGHRTRRRGATTRYRADPSDVISAGRPAAGFDPIRCFLAVVAYVGLLRENTNNKVTSNLTPVVRGLCVCMYIPSKVHENESHRVSELYAFHLVYVV